MDAIKIKLKLGDGVNDILKALTQTKATKIYFMCPRHFGILTDVSFLKKCRSTAIENGKQIAFITNQKFLRGIIKSQKIASHSAPPAETGDWPTVNLGELFGRVDAHKNVQIKKEPEPIDPSLPIKPPIFSLRRIENHVHEKSIRGRVFFIFLLTTTLLLGVFFWISPSATITIKSKISIVPITQNVIIKLSDAEVPEENQWLPQISGIFTETQITGEQTFPSTDRLYELSNASGEVTLFNQESEPKYLLPSRLATPEGVIVRFADPVTIPGRTADGPGRLIVKVTADEYDANEKPIGARGNIEAGTEFIFPALREESRELFYAKANRGPLVGGSTLTHYLVQASDSDGARELLQSSFRTRATEKLEIEIKQRSNREGRKFVLLEDRRLLTGELIDYQFPEHLIGQETQTFSVQGTLKLSGLVFDQSAVVKFLTEKIERSQNHRKKLLSIDENSVSYRLLEVEDFEAQKWVKVSVSLAGVEALSLESSHPDTQKWKQDLQKEVAGKNRKQAQNLLTNHPDIENVIDLKISPFWSDTLPRIFEQIEFKIQQPGS
jgi:hypothetical protein